MYVFYNWRSFNSSSAMTWRHYLAPEYRDIWVTIHKLLTGWTLHAPPRTHHTELNHKIYAGKCGNKCRDEEQGVGKAVGGPITQPAAWHCWSHHILPSATMSSIWQINSGHRNKFALWPCEFITVPALSIDYISRDWGTGMNHVWDVDGTSVGRHSSTGPLPCPQLVYQHQ